MDAITNPTTFLVVGGAGVLIPLAVAFLTNLEASPTIKSLVAVVLAGLTAAGAAIADVGDIASDWKQVVGAGAVALIGAGASLAAVWKDTVEEKIHEWSDSKIGIG